MYVNSCIIRSSIMQPAWPAFSDKNFCNKVEKLGYFKHWHDQLQYYRFSCSYLLEIINCDV